MSDVFSNASIPSQKNPISKEEATKMINELQEERGQIAEKTHFIRMITTFDEADRELAISTVSYLVTFLNNDTLRGNISYSEFERIYIDGCKGLWRLMYIALHDENAPTSGQWETYINRRDAYYTSARLDMYLMLTRVYQGRDYDYEMKKLEKDRPQNIVISGNQSQR